MKFINASIIIFTSVVVTSDIFADAAQQLRGRRGLVENEDVLVSFVNDTITGEIISNVENIAHPTPPMISASERANDQVSDYGSECRASDCCTCSAKHVYKSTPRDCILVQSTSAVKKALIRLGKHPAIELTNLPPMIVNGVKTLSFTSTS